MRNKVRNRVRNKIIVFVVAASALACTLFLTTASQATTTSVDLGITGNTVAGFTKAQYGQELPVTFTIKNRSTTTAAEVAFYFTLTHATADGSDYTCPLVSNRYNINPDTPACEPGVLGYGRSTSAAILVTPTISSGTVTVKACAQDLTGYADPVSSNNCKTVSIAIG
jgi:hypothetical protein